MLHELTITDLGVIESAHIDFPGGLTCVTGETGAGKTMVLAGLGLILGAKAVPATVRDGADAALAEAVVDIPASAEVVHRLADAGVMIDEDGTLVVSRSVGATTRSRAVMGGRTVPQSLLGDVAAELVIVHGQADQARLRSPAHQRTTLDEYAGPDHGSLLETYGQAWQEWTAATARLEQLATDGDAMRAEMDRLRADLDAIAVVDPQPGELARLEHDISVLDHADTVLTGVAGAHEQLAGDQDGVAVAALLRAERALDGAVEHDDSLAPTVKELADLRYRAADIASHLAGYREALDVDPRRLDALHQRRSDLLALVRRIGASDLDELLRIGADAAARVAQDGEWDEQVDRAKQRRRYAADVLAAAAASVTDSRRQAAVRLADAVNGELAALAMADAQVTIAVEPTEAASHGADIVTMMVVPHPGAQTRPVAQAASGGELSRIMLAIEVSLAGGAEAPPRTFIFDEVDAGIGGKAAIAVGGRLAALARTHQVVVVTHLAQVAAFADSHIVVEKSSDGAVTRAQVRVVAGDARVQEIARLLSGQESSDTARAHALELLEASRTAP